ncbi:MAG: Brp/Blh family beta-carotene 15,15'-dioxygenase [Pseudomonadota bacterium]
MTDANKHTIAFVALTISLTLATVLFGPVPLSLQGQTFLLAFAVLFVGLPHGAFDAMLARRIGAWRGPRGFVFFHVVYIAVAAFVGLTWVLFPGPALALFLCFSAFHFGGDWRNRISIPERTIVGFALLATTALFHHAGVAAIFEAIAGPAGPILAGWMAEMGKYLLPVAALIAIKSLYRDISASVEILAVLTLAIALPPLLFFVLYFCGLHSLKHVLDGLAGDMAPKMRKTGRLVAAYVAGSAFLTVPFGLLASSAGLTQYLTAQVFIGLAALSVPHMLLVEYSSASRLPWVSVR